MSKVQAFEEEYLRKKIPSFKPGDTVRVHVRVVEGDRERVQVFQGTVLRRQGGGLSETFTVRKVSFGVGTERTFPVHSPMVAKVEIKSRGTVRRAKLYYLRERVGKKARVKEMFVEGGLVESADIGHSEIEKKRLGETSPEAAEAQKIEEPEVQKPEESPEAEAAERPAEEQKVEEAEVASSPEEQAPRNDGTSRQKEIALEAEKAPAEETAAAEETTPAVETAPVSAEVQQPASRDEARDLTEDKPEEEKTTAEKTSSVKETETAVETEAAEETSSVKETESAEEATAETEETPQT